MPTRRSKLAYEFELFRYDPREWFVLTGDRLLVSLLHVVVLAIVFTIVMLSGLVPLEHETPVLFLLFALIAANFTLIAIVTSLSQFILSRQLEAPGEIRETMDETIAYREDVGETIGQPVMPVKPDAFFLFLFENARQDLEELETLRLEGRTRRTREELEDLVSGLKTHTDDIITLLEHPSSEMKHALFVALNTSYETHVHRAWYLESEYTDEFTDRVTEPLGTLIETLEHIVVASRMFEATFIESEVSELSRVLLYVGLPAQVAAIVLTLLYTPADATPMIPESALVVVVVPAIVIAGVTPFFILSSYIVRLTVVARRTSENFPFSSQLKNTLALRDSYIRDE